MGILLILVILFFGGLVVLAIAVASHYGKVEKEMQNQKLASGSTKGAINDSINEAKEKLRIISNSSRAIEDETIKAVLVTITKQGDEILQEIKRDPSDIKRARKFMNYYLDATINVLKNYTLLSSKNIEAHQEVFQKVLPLLEDIRKGFEYEYAKLFEKELMDLDVEIEVLKKTIEQDINNKEF